MIINSQFFENQIKNPNHYCIDSDFFAVREGLEPPKGD
jgi:hypothetical protein